MANTFQIGLRATSSNAASVWNTADLDVGTTYLVVMKYKIVTGNANDTAYIWVNPTTGSSEPAYDLIQESALATDPATVARLALRQGANAVNASIDGIRVGTTWADVCPPTSTPFISVNPSSLNFGTTALTDTSAEMSYIVSGSNLTAGITVTAPSTDFRVSLASGSGYTNTVTIPQTGGAVAPTAIYVIFKPTGTEGLKTGNITNASARLGSSLKHVPRLNDMSAFTAGHGGLKGRRSCGHHDKVGVLLENEVARDFDPGANVHSMFGQHSFVVREHVHELRLVRGARGPSNLPADLGFLIA